MPLPLLLPLPVLGRQAKTAISHSNSTDKSEDTAADVNLHKMSQARPTAKGSRGCLSSGFRISWYGVDQRSRGAGFGAS